MYIVPFTSESSDHYLIGPFDHLPSQAEVMSVFQKQCPDEAAYVQEMLDAGHLNTPFTAYRLSDGAAVLDFQMGGGERCT